MTTDKIGNHQKRQTAGKLWLGFAMIIFILLLLPIHDAYAAEAIVEVGIPVEENPELFIYRSMPTHGNGKIAVFLIDFPDYRNTDPTATREYFESLYFSGTGDYNCGYDSVASFYSTQSYGKLCLSGHVFDWYTARHERSYYDDRKGELIMEAAAYYESLGFDMSQFDGDGDGVVDAVTFHFAGDITTERYTSWYGGVTQSTGAENGFGTIGGLRFHTIVQIGSGREISTICHELMHTLGMPDLYGEVYFALDPTTDLMSSNSAYLNPYTKILLGWIDSIRVISEETRGVTVDVYDQDGTDFILVTKEYHGLFDEFYIVAYRQKYNTTTATIWHIDARLDENGEYFINQNLYYDPRPDKKTGHNDGYASTYLFIEELCADPDYNFVIMGEGTGDHEKYGYGQNSVLGPNSAPSSDTHSGEYTGICIQGFVPGEESLTFDVLFVEDNKAPILKTQNDDLDFQKTITIQFNEFVYEGENFDAIKVLDSNGNPIDANILLPHYPKHRLEIVFSDDSYRNGYTIILPENCLKDSSGNAIFPTKLTCAPVNLLAPVETTKLPDADGHFRDNGKAYFFPVDDEILVITGCWGYVNGNHESDTWIEFMRLDGEGNMLSQLMVENPCKKVSPGGSIFGVYQTQDNNYIFVYQTPENIYMTFCMNNMGKILWEKEIPTFPEYICSGPQVKIPQGLVFWFYSKENGDFSMKLLLLRFTGEIKELPEEMNEEYKVSSFYTISNEMYFKVNSFIINGEHFTRIQLYHAETEQLIAETMLPCGNFSKDIVFAHQNSDGTIVAALRNYKQEDIVEFFVFDQDLNVIRSTSQNKSNIENFNSEVIFFDNDGFVYINYERTQNHDNSIYRVTRYDRYLNLIWENYLEANFIYYFQSPTGEIMAYRSMYSPERACYIDSYGSEEAFRIAHTHNLLYVNEAEATCTAPGHTAHWHCVDCGENFSDEGKTFLSSINTDPMTPHMAVEIPLVPPTCTENGYTAGLRCIVCEKFFEKPDVIPATGRHNYGSWEVVEEATCTKFGLKMRCCQYPGCEVNETQEILSIGDHMYGEWQVIEKATCGKKGSQSRQCTVCQNTETRTMDEKGRHKFGEWQVIEEPTCVKEGSQSRQCTVCQNTETRTMDEKGPHKFGEWAVKSEAACTNMGLSVRQCTLCGEEESLFTTATGIHNYGNWTIIGQSEVRACQDCGYSEEKAIPPSEPTTPTPPADTSMLDTTELCIAAGVVAIASATLTYLVTRRRKK